MALPNQFPKPIAEKVEVFEFHKCVLCNTEYLIEDSFNIDCTYLFTGETLYRFLCKISDTENILSGISHKYMCRNCLHLVHVLVNAEMHYKKAKADFDAVIRKNPLFSLPIKKIKIENFEAVTPCSISFDKQSLNGVKNNKSNLVKIKKGPGDRKKSALMREESNMGKIKVYTHNVNPSHPQKESHDNMTNYGSELDSEDDENLAAVPNGITRTMYVLMDTPRDPEPTSTLDALESEPAWLSNPFYDFKWKSHPKPPIPQESRRERFTVPDTGPKISYTKPIDIFKHIWDEEIMEAIAAETNRYAEDLVKKLDRDSRRPLSRISDWKDTTPEELYVFFGIILAMGVVFKSKLSDYWSTSNDVVAKSGFNSYMSLRRFQLLFTCLHFNNAQIPPTDKSSEAKLMKIKPILDHLNNKFQEMYVMDRNIGLDETLLQRDKWQYIPNRKAKAKLKSYELCEVQTGYLWRFIIDSNSPEAMTSLKDPLEDSTTASVLKLLKGLEHKGYTVWMDDTYNSPVLARKLKSLGFDCVGPVRANRQFVPIAIMNLDKSQLGPAQVGSVTTGDVDLMVWRDQNLVSALSTYHGIFVSTDSDGTKPILIRDYITVMEGLDTKDRILSLYAIERNRNHVWYKNLFLRLLNVSVFNAYVIHWHQNERLITHREFRMGLVKLLLKEFDVENSYDLRHHYLKEYPFLTGSKARLKRMCVVCRGLATMFCAGCNKTTCLDCFRQVHL